MEEIEHYDLQFSQRTAITDDAMISILKNSKYLQISNNKLKALRKAISEVGNSTELWRGKSPYEWNCDMMWMRDWLILATNVMDREEATYAKEKMKDMSRKYKM